VNITGNQVLVQRLAVMLRHTAVLCTSQCVAHGVGSSGDSADVQ
jgi:hypothetical protein